MMAGLMEMLTADKMVGKLGKMLASLWELLSVGMTVILMGTESDLLKVGKLAAMMEQMMDPSKAMLLAVSME